MKKPQSNIFVSKAAVKYGESYFRSFKIIIGCAGC